MLIARIAQNTKGLLTFHKIFDILHGIMNIINYSHQKETRNVIAKKIATKIKCNCIMSDMIVQEGVIRFVNKNNRIND